MTGRLTHHGVIAALGFTLCTAGLCGQDVVREVGSLESYGYPVLTVPDSVRAGKAFTVTVNTYGSSSCLRASGADLWVDGHVVTITPYDTRPAREPVLCTGDISPHPHVVRVTVQLAGVATIRVRGYRGVDGRRTLGTVQRVITVLP